MSTKTALRGALTADGGKLRAWTGVPVGVGMTYAAGRVMPDFTQITNDWLYPLPYCAPAALLGVAALLSAKTKRAGYGVLGGTAAYYLWAVISNLTSGTRQMPEATVEGAPVQILGGQTPRPIPPRRAAPRR